MTAVTLIALPGALGSTLTIPLEMLSAARDIARSRRDPTAELSLTIASDGHRSVELMGGMRLECESSLPDLTSMPASHIVFIPGFWGNPRAMLLRNAGVVSWLASQQPAIVCAITTGSYFIAEAGLLDDCDATTHWRFFDDFANRSPRVPPPRTQFFPPPPKRSSPRHGDAARHVMPELAPPALGPQ